MMTYQFLRFFYRCGIRFTLHNPDAVAEPTPTRRGGAAPETPRRRSASRRRRAPPRSFRRAVAYCPPRETGPPSPGSGLAARRVARRRRGTAHRTDLVCRRRRRAAVPRVPCTHAVASTLLVVLSPEYPSWTLFREGPAKGYHRLDRPGRHLRRVRTRSVLSLAAEWRASM